MAKRNTYDSYGSISKFFHWSIALLVIGMITYGFVLHHLFPRPWKPIGYQIHELIGISILFLMVSRVIWALMNPKPKLPRGVPIWEILLSRLSHFVMYLVLLAIPLSGWIMATAKGHPPHLLGISFNFPGFSTNKAIEIMARNTHETLVFVIIGLIVLHLLAALRHHFIIKNKVLKRMLPGKS